MIKLLLWFVMIALILWIVVEFIGLLTEFLIAITPLILITIAALSIGALVWSIIKLRKRKKSLVPSTIKKLMQDGVTSSASTKEELEEFHSRNRLIRSFHTRVVGVKYENEDGSSRQEILSHCLRGEPVGFYWHDFQGAPACAVISDHGQIGYLGADLASDLHIEYNDERYCFVAQISDITGGCDGYYYGCNLLISIYEEIE